MISYAVQFLPQLDRCNNNKICRNLHQNYDKIYDNFILHAISYAISQAVPLLTNHICHIVWDIVYYIANDAISYMISYARSHTILPWCYIIRLHSMKCSMWYLSRYSTPGLALCACCSCGHASAPPAPPASLLHHGTVVRWYQGRRRKSRVKSGAVGSWSSGGDQAWSPCLDRRRGSELPARPGELHNGATVS